MYKLNSREDEMIKKLEEKIEEEIKVLEIEFADEPLFMRKSRVMEILDVSQGTIDRLLNSGDLAKVKMGDTKQSAMRIPKSSLLRYLARLKHDVWA